MHLLSDLPIPSTDLSIPMSLFDHHSFDDHTGFPRVMESQGMSWNLIRTFCGNPVIVLTFSCFFPLQGTRPTGKKIEGMNIANPTAMLLASAEMLDHIGYV